MKGYLSFVLVLVSLSLILLLLNIQPSQNFSKAISLERISSIQMNLKEVLIESIRQGAQSGFADYDTSHSLEDCTHCIDHFCSVVPLEPNYCNELLCSGCFRESDARTAASAEITLTISKLKNYSIDHDFSFSLTEPEFEVFLKPDLSSKNGFTIDFVRLKKDLILSLQSEKFNTSNSAKLPKGLVVE